MTFACDTPRSSGSLAEKRVLKASRSRHVHHAVAAAGLPRSSGREGRVGERKKRPREELCTLLRHMIRERVSTPSIDSRFRKPASSTSTSDAFSLPRFSAISALPMPLCRRRNLCTSWIRSCRCKELGRPPSSRNFVHTLYLFQIISKMLSPRSANEILLHRRRVCSSKTLRRLRPHYRTIGLRVNLTRSTVNLIKEF